MTWDQEMIYEPERPLWPDFVEEDYREVVGIVGRYALYTGVPDFSFAQLEDHLAAQNVELIGESDWPTLFAEMQEDIVRDLTERGRSYEWRQRRVGRQTLYSLMNMSPDEGAVDAAVSVDERTDDSAEEADVPESAEALDLRLDQLFEGIADHRIRTKELPALIMRRFGVNEEEADGMIQAARTVQRLHRHTTGVISYLSLDPPAEPAKRVRRTATHADAEREARPLREDEVAAAERIMDELAASGSHVTEGSTIKRLEHELQLGLSPSELRRLLRHMESMKFISIDNSGNYRQARKSPRVRIRGQDMKQRWNGNRDGYVGRLRSSKMPG